MSKNNSISKKQIGINMIANIVSYSANIIVSFILTPFLINNLGKETYSFFPIANTIVVYMSVLTNSLNSMASRFVTVSIVREESDEANKYFSSTLAANLFLSAILIVPLSLSVVFLDRIMDVPINSVAAIKILFALVFASALINISAAVFGIATFAKNRIDLRSLRELVSAILKLSLFFVLYRFLPPSIIYVGIVALVVALVNIAFQFFYTRFLLPEIKLKKEFISIKHTKILLGASCWNAINSFGNVLLTGTSMIIANMFYGAAASGAFSIVNTVPQFINGVIVMLVGIFYPVITHKFAQNDYDGLISELKNAQRLVGLFGCATISVFSSLAVEFFRLWTPKEDAIFLSTISFITILPHFIISCMWPLTNLNVVMNKVKIPAIFTLICGAFNVITAFFIYKFLSPGLISIPIISSVIQIIWIGIFIPIYASKNLNVKLTTFYPDLIKCIICSVVVYFFVSITKMMFAFNSWVKFIIFGGIYGLIALILFVLVLVGPKNIIGMIKRIILEKNI